MHTNDGTLMLSWCVSPPYAGASTVFGVFFSVLPAETPNFTPSPRHRPVCGVPHSSVLCTSEVRNFHFKVSIRVSVIDHTHCWDTRIETLGGSCWIFSLKTERDPRRADFTHWTYPRPLEFGEISMSIIDHGID